MMCELGFVECCYLCDEEYEYCECEPFTEGFEFEGYTIFEPNVDVSGDRLVDPVVYYGQAYIEWTHSNRIEHERTEG